MKASKLHAWFIASLSVLATLYISLAIIFRSAFGTSSRESVNNLIRWWGKAILKLVKAKLEIFNPHHVVFEPEHKYIVMSNHTSLYDIPIIDLAIPGNIRTLTKKELFKVPFWGNAMAKADYVSIDRDNPRQAVKDLRVAKEKIESGIILWIAPEGTRSKTGELQPFKKGGFKLALKAKATIIPFGIRGSEKILPAKTMDFSLGEKIEVHIGKPIEAANYTNENSAQLMKDVEDSIREALGKY